MNHHITGKRSRAFAVAFAATCAALVAATPASAGLPVTGPASNVTPFPLYVEDANGLRLALCEDPADGCVFSELPDASQPASFPDNYAAENFYFMAESALSSGGVTADLVLALETAFSNEAAVAGEEEIFSRVRLNRVEGLPPNQTFRVLHPYGEFSITTDGDGLVRRAEHAPDTGCGGEAVACSPDTWHLATDAFLGDQAGAGVAAPFLTWDPPASAPTGHIGNAATPHTVTGSTVLDETGAPQNYFRIVGAGVDVRTTAFVLQGKLAPADPSNPPSTPNMADASDTGWSHLDDTTRDTTPTFTGRASSATVELLAGDAVVGTADVVNGAYTVTVADDKALADGNHVMKVRSGGVTSANGLTVKVDTQAPTAPAISTVTALSSSSARLAWSGVEGAERYTVYRDRKAFTTRLAGEIGGGSNATLTNLAGKVTLAGLTATDEAGNVSAMSALRGVGVPNRVRAAANHGSTSDRVVNARVTWTYPNENGAKVTSYKVVATRIGTGQKITRVTTARQYYFTGLVRNGKYTFTVAATNRFGTGVASLPSNAAIAR